LSNLVRWKVLPRSLPQCLHYISCSGLLACFISFASWVMQYFLNHLVIMFVFLRWLWFLWPFTVPTWSKAWVLVAWILGSCVWSLSLCVVSCGSRGLASGWCPVHGVLPNVEMIHNCGSHSELQEATRLMVLMVFLIISIWFRFSWLCLGILCHIHIIVSDRSCIFSLHFLAEGYLVPY
jgi:hypothetical protein